ncbi:alpha/beta hydrolase family protein [Microbacterium sp. bgisy207]|uniref:alpha/beta hydrolase family protein n=1 Tax=Microbacterium sp. bgisy207 TaxID=3413800 RepID=UPI003EBFD439
MAHLFGRHAHDVFETGFYSEDFDFDVRIQLGMAPYGGADAGEVLRTIVDVKDGDHEAWFSAWSALGARLRTQAEGSDAAGHRVSAASAYLRCANAFAVAVNAAAALGDDDRLHTAFRAHRSAWDAFVDRAPYRAERVEVPYGDETMPGYFFAASDGPGPLPTLILVNGSDGAISGMWATGGLGGLRRGYNVFMFDGPGQQSMLFDRNIPFRHDWEAVLTPVVDTLVARADVDAARLAAYGISQAGYWLPRALAFEHRIAAAVADPGVVDVSQSWLAHFPKSELALVEKGEKEKFDHGMRLAMHYSASVSRLWKFRARPYGKDSPYDTIVEMMTYRLSDEDAARITTPLLITSPEKEQFWPGQSEQLAQMVPNGTLQPFTADEGADYHCQPLARLLTDERMFDWLDVRLGR